MKIITTAQAQRYLKKGWKAADLHVHTNKSYDVLPDPDLDPEALYKKAKARGMGFVVFTDHDTFEAHEQFQAKDLITSVEIRILDKQNVGHTVHINVYGLNKQQFLELEYIANEKQDIFEFAAYCKKHELAFQYNHPYWTEAGEWCSHKGVDHIAKLFPVIELNLGRVKLKNDLALNLAKRHKKGVAANTDTHSGDVGHACTLAPGETFQQWWRNVEKGNCVIVRQDLTVANMVAEVNKRIHTMFNPQLRKDQLYRYRWKTGRKPIDVLVRGLLFARNYGLGRWIMKTVMLLISHSRIPVVVYLRNERKSGEKLQKAIHRT